MHWFGLSDPALAVNAAGAFDARWCGRCGGSFRYEVRYYSHMGIWSCSGCERSRAEPATSATNLDIRLDGATFNVRAIGQI